MEDKLIIDNTTCESLYSKKLNQDENYSQKVEDEVEKRLQKDALIDALRCLVYCSKDIDRKMLGLVKVFILDNKIEIPNDLLNLIGPDLYDFELGKERIYYYSQFERVVTNSERTTFYFRYQIVIKLIQYLTLKMYDCSTINLKENINHVYNNYVYFSDDSDFYTNTILNMSKEEITFFKTKVFTRNKEIEDIDITLSNTFKVVRNYYIESLINKCYSKLSEKELAHRKIFSKKELCGKKDQYILIWFRNLITRPYFKEFYETLSDYRKCLINSFINNERIRYDDEVDLLIDTIFNYKSRIYKRVK